MNVAIVFSSIFPYRTPVFNLLGDDYTVIYQCKREPNRSWNPGNLGHKAIFLKERYLRLGWEKFFHWNPDIFRILSKLNPDVVVIYGDTLTQQFAALWAKIHHKPLIYWTDGWEHTEKGKSYRQKWIERWIVRKSQSFIATGIKTREYLISLGAEAERISISRIVR